ncbi:hypothetical protein BD309DRAFT_878036 [Dichomitus squalens]|uniref:Bacteriophage T5 Orf172 DNA-binding domain-containing protein n=2 Tax=Dichomitus squalens TaxID=114155 RepID=A0A4Q9M6G5_9APHY|nr:uncharacterized protein DICSQDRAFT_130095 [Dichomitus squalens LYAD-421 SS1]EJF56433.1 hypothetical protein DICSQDRAFT_130095 [Dichomitus squalens LYAD-421 SS1]TBU21186.1 hypothetical protein BD311DRAFT_679113 [Dichomitus squalens]TBU36622.1 hypothetical protein BD309DRAFT_878036 [Dichomitus squalens]TBU53042.1 hypothetical protein BD310DRAFT_830992 [Dichomitus squalens]
MSYTPSNTTPQRAAIQKYRAVRLPPSKVQCSGVTHRDVRCSRLVPTSTVTPYPNAADLPFYCEDHLQQGLAGTHFKCLRFPGEVRPFNAYIPPYVEDITEVYLRETLRKPPSQSDTWGYLYALLILDASVGRTNQLNRRYSEHLRNCPSLHPVLLGYYPPNPDESPEDLAAGRIKPGRMVPYVQRLERLVHLELADVAVNAPYLSPTLPHQTPKGSRMGIVPERVPCKSCHHVHEEIFSLRRYPGSARGREWEYVVYPIIMRYAWHVERFCPERLIHDYLLTMTQDSINSRFLLTKTTADYVFLFL